MLIFIDSEGNVVGRTPGGLTQGSSKANVLQLVAPFPTAIASVSFQLPNGIVLGPGLEDGLGEAANEYVMTEAFKIPGYGVGGSELTVFNITCNKQITALAGNLGIQFFLSIGEIIEGANEEPPVYGGYTIAVPMINVPVYNGTRFIPNAPITSENYDIYTDILEIISGIQTTTEAILNQAVLKDPPADEYGRQIQRIEGTIETDSIIARDIGVEGIIETDGGVDLSSGAPIQIKGTDKDGNEVKYYIKGYKKLDENNDEYLVGIALIGDENYIEGKTNFLGDVIFTKPVSINDTATINKAARFLGGRLGKRTSNSADRTAITLDPDMGIRFDGDHEENSIEDSGISIKPIYGYEPYPVDTTIVSGVQIAGNPLLIYNPEEEELVAVDRNLLFSVLGDIRASGKVTAKNVEVQERFTANGVATFNDDVYVEGSTLHALGGSFSEISADNLTVLGDLNVGGKTTSVEHETLVIKDNIIVTNSDGLNITASGLVINKGNGKAYGILYQPQGDLVYIGEGTYSVSGGIPYFDFDEGQALPLAARSENFPNGEIPIFDAATASFKPSGKAPSSFVEKTAQTSHRVAYVNARGDDTTMQIVNDFTDGAKFTVYTLACRNKDGCITVNDPINPLDTVNKRTLDNALANLPSGGSGSGSWIFPQYPNNNIDWFNTLDNKPSEIIANLTIYFGDIHYKAYRIHFIKEEYGYFTTNLTMQMLNNDYTAFDLYGGYITTNDYFTEFAFFGGSAEGDAFMDMVENYGYSFELEVIAYKE